MSPSSGTRFNSSTKTGLPTLLGEVDEKCRTVLEGHCDATGRRVEVDARRPVRKPVVDIDAVCTGLFVQTVSPPYDRWCSS